MLQLTLALSITTLIYISEVNIYNCSHLDYPAVDLVNATICDNNISVCVNITGTPHPSTTIQTQEDVSMVAKNQSQFCSTFDKPNAINILTVFITASNCFGSTTASAFISFINGKYEQYFK